jgi:hypothetical protein
MDPSIAARTEKTAVPMNIIPRRADRQLVPNYESSSNSEAFLRADAPG